MEYAMADRCDLIDVGDNTVILVYESFKDHLDCLLMCRHRSFAYIVFLARHLVCQNRAVNTDTLAETFCLYGLICNIDQLILE